MFFDFLQLYREGKNVFFLFFFRFLCLYITHLFLLVHSSFFKQLHTSRFLGKKNKKKRITYKWGNTWQVISFFFFGLALPHDVVDEFEWAFARE